MGVDRIGWVHGRSVVVIACCGGCGRRFRDECAARERVAKKATQPTDNRRRVAALFRMERRPPLLGRASFRRRRIYSQLRPVAAPSSRAMIKVTWIELRRRCRCYARLSRLPGVIFPIGRRLSENRRLLVSAALIQTAPACNYPFTSASTASMPGRHSPYDP